ncbi:hypothetical protein KDU71_05150 [Carboxylicivirga sediminis]|uniref:Type II secretion system protein GspC N-terminal domain-containing protein n=1 Tax=Carboxylicivirga sediminis TaxID=2006564 RepID=A0A941F272_9BACT|nr:hypothetical protein [Carboxylicivirga sediminis]MBR8534939.1 hypothetical protein [Carboxylicivirga sediminis]
MKNKKSLYILIPLAVVVWGTIFWKVFSGSGNNSTVEYQSNQVLSNKEISKDTIRRQLSYNYSDPFLKNQTKPSVEQPQEPKNEQRTINRVVRWPMVEFKGTVKSRRKNRTMAILQISSRKYLVRENELKDQVKVLAITPDSIGLEYQNDKRYFKRNGL